MAIKTTRPTIGERMSLGKGLDAYSDPKADATWEETHHRRTIWLSDDLWEAVSQAAASDPDRSKSSLCEEALRSFFGLAPE